MCALVATSHAQCTPLKCARVSQLWQAELLLFESFNTATEQPEGIRAIAALMLLLAVVAAAYCLALLFGAMALARGAWLVGGGMETMGPAIFGIYAAVHGLCGVGLLRRSRLAWRLTIFVLIFGFVQVVPAISMAVADSRILAIIREGAQIIFRVVALWYLLQEHVREWYASRYL